MADKVRQMIESMVWELKGLEKRGFFSETEIKDVLSTRESQEYSLAKNSCSKLDFFKAIQYEMSLETLRKERFIDLQMKRIKESDYHIIKRIIMLFDRTTNKFRYYKDAWKQYLRFCVQIKSKKNFWKVLSRCLKFNSEHLDFWLIGIYYEFDMNKNPFKGRQVFHKALKMNGKNLDFWIEYLRFEAKFVKLVEQRQNFLLDKDGKKSDKEDFNKDDFQGFEKVQDDNESDILEFEDSEEDEEKMQLETDQESQGKSTHELILVIVESIIDTFKEDDTYKTTTIYEKVLEVLFFERENSEEIENALKKIEEMLKSTDNSENLTDIENFNYGLKELELKIEECLKKEVTIASVLHSINLLDEYCKPQNKNTVTFRVVRNILRIAEIAASILNENLILKIKNFLKPNLEMLVGKQQGQSDSLEFVELLVKLDKENQLVCSKEILSYLESNKYTLDLIELYMKYNLNESQGEIKLKYLDNQYKEVGSKKVAGLSYTERVNWQQKIIGNFVISFNKMLNKNSQSQEKLKNTYSNLVKKLQQLAGNNLDILAGLGKIFTQLFQEKEISLQSQEVIVGELWKLKQLCPKSIIIYAISNMKSFSNMQKIDEAIAMFPNSLDLWKNCQRIAKENHMTKNLSKMLDKGLKDLGNEANLLLEYYEEEINN